VKSSGRSTGPFMLVLRDPLKHIESLQENKKFSDDLGKGHESDYRYAINVPKGDTYTPVMRYKCVANVRPVPLVSVAEPSFVLEMKLVVSNVSSCFPACANQGKNGR
jgi:hypothetical protein